MKDRIKFIRQAYGMTQEEFAEYLLLTRTQISLIESGNSKPSAPTFASLCRIFHVRPDWLLNGDGSVFNVPITEIEKPIKYTFSISSHDECAERIIELRHFLGLSQTDFARRIGHYSSVISGIERHTVTVNVRHIAAIVSVFGCSDKWLLFGEGDMFSDQPNAFGDCGRPTFGADLEVGNRVKSTRKQLGFTLADFAAVIGSSHSVVCGIEKGNATISNKLICAICSAFHVNAKWLRFGVGEQFNSAQTVFPPKRDRKQCRAKEKRTDLSKLPDRIAAVRLHFGMAQPTFAKILGITTSMLSYIETGKRGLSEKHVKTICEHFHVNEQWLRTGEGEMLDNGLL